MFIQYNPNPLYVNGSVNDPATTPTPLINVVDGSLSISRTA